ncbi:MAG: SDR family oxidoreductase [Planctomycetaceae bacterium]|nr:SDR family oxidoreductase [Planctomycetaceae bacterium]
MSKNRFDVAGKSVIITGGAGMLGSEYAAALSDMGARVAVADANSDRAAALAKKVPGSIAVTVDIVDPDSVRAMVAAVLDAFGRIDSLVNNAALDPKFDPGNAGKHTSAFENLPLEVWQQSLDVNLTGMFLCTQAVVPHMLSQGAGTIINISSTYGMCGPDQRLYESDDPSKPVNYKPVTYTVTKSAVFGFTKYLATYYGLKGIRTNTLTIGGVYNNHAEEFVRRYSSRTPMGRMARKDEYCGALAFLISDASSYMTGSNLVCDGGWSAW